MKITIKGGKMKKMLAVMVVVAVLVVCGAALAEKTKKVTKTTTQEGPKEVWLREMNPNYDKCRWSNTYEYESGQLAGNIYPAAFMFSDSEEECNFDLGKKFDTFEAVFGIDDRSGECASKIAIFGDNKKLYASDFKKKGDDPDFINVSVKGIKKLKIVKTTSTESVHDCYFSGTSNGIVIGDPKLIIGATAPKKETTASTKTSTTTETTEETESSCDGSSNIIIDSKSLETLANNLAEQAKDAGLAKTGKVQLAITKFKLVSICKKSGRTTCLTI